MRLYDSLDSPASSITPLISVDPEPKSMAVSHGDISVEDTVWVEAWSQVARSVSGYNVGSLEDGGDCIRLTTRSDSDDADAEVHWLISRDSGRVLARGPGTGRCPADHDSMREALQSIAALSATEMRSVTLIAEAMLLSLEVASVDYATAA
jgi:hypothetical protein